MKFLLDRQLGFVHVTNASIVPATTWRAADGGVKDVDGKLISSSMWNECIDNQAVTPPSLTNFSRSFENNLLVYGSKRCIFLGYFVVSCYGHVITDNLKKLWFLQTDYCKRLWNLGYEVVYITQANETVPRYMEELFAFAGCDIKQCRQITELETFDDVVVPDSCLFYKNGSLFYTQEYVHIIDRIKLSVEKHFADVKAKPKIYYTRRRIKSKRTAEYNEQCVENEFRKAGYEIIAPETLSVGQCIYYTMKCSYFAASEGSVSHNILFCNENAQCVVLKKADYTNPYSTMVDDVSGCKVEYVKAHHSSCANRKEPWNGPFFFCITPQLEAFFGYKIPHKPFFLHMSFWKMRLETNRIYRKCRKIFMKLCNLVRS